MDALAFAPAAALLAAAAFAGSRRARLSEGLVLVALACAIALAAVLVAAGAETTPLIGIDGIGLSARRDVVGVTLLLLITFVGWIVVRFTATYLDGEPRAGVFMRWLCLTLASVMALAIAGNLVLLVVAWIATSLALHRLLLFYPTRPGAQRAARKKFIAARAADAALIAAAVLLAGAYGTTDIATILVQARAGVAPGLAAAAAACLAVAAMLKSAQFPLHGWLTEVMEAPTPVSALLHAGVINAGGFVLIRFADVMLLSPAALALLVLVGGFTALFGGLVMLTQPAVKTSLAWSTVAQMGFMTMECGFGLFPLALLHLVAHSLYKAHSFLAAGGAVERIVAAARPGPVAVPSPRAVARAFAVALGLYAAIGAVFGIADAPPQVIMLGAILIFGVAYLIAQGLADAAPRTLTRRLVVLSLAASLGYFVLHALAERLTVGTVPPPPGPSSLDWALMILAVLSFGAAAVAQALFPLWSGHPAAAGLRVHLSNGLYANAVLDRLLGGWQRKGATL